MSEQDQRDWGNVRFRTRRGMSSGAPEDWANVRFLVAVLIFVGVALVYPWYSYWVQSRLLVMELEQGIEEVTQQVDAEVRKANAQIAERVAARDRQSARQRIAAVRVTGVSQNSGAPVVVVKLGQASVSESQEVICRQAEAWLRDDLSGKRIRVQKDRGDVTVEVGTIRC